MLVVVGFLLIILLVIAHEAGHFWAARRNGIEVEEFGIGFPPKAKTLATKNGTEYTLNWLPLGGFVKLKGENDSDTTPGSFGAARLKDKVKVMIAGVGVNFLIAFILFTIISLIGMPKLIDDQFVVESDNTITKQEVIIGKPAEGSPAESIGLELNDSILSITEAGDCENCEKREFKNTDELGAATSYFAEKDVVVEFKHKDQIKTAMTTLRSVEQVDESVANFKSCADSQPDNVEDCPPAIGHLGVNSDDFTVQRATWSAPIVGAGVTYQFTKVTLQGLGDIVFGLLKGNTEPATEQVSGVIGVGFIFSGSSFLGSVFMLMIVAVISLSLAIMNILPIPALDGGRLFVTLLFRAIRRPLTKETEERIHGTGFAVLMVLFLLISILDVQRFVLN